MSDELESCPCGGQVYVGELKFTGETQWCVGCLQCNRDSGRHADKAEAIAAWNRRASPTPEGRGAVQRVAEFLCCSEGCEAEARARQGSLVQFNCRSDLKLETARACAALLSSPRVEEVRREALEEAAKVVLSLGDHIAVDTLDKHEHAYKSALIGAAAAILALSPPVG